MNFEGDRGEYNYMMGQQCHRLPIVDDIVVGDQVIVAATGKRGVIAGGCEGSATKVQVDVDGKTGDCGAGGPGSCAARGQVSHEG